jgi:hypothetical protein
MSYSLTITEKSTYLHVVVTGPNTIENVLRYLEEVQRKCASLGCRRVLIEERLEGPRVDIGQVFEIVTGGRSASIHHFDAIAYVDVNARGDLMKFAETMALNRGMPVKVFASVNEAERWLLNLQ